MRGPFVHFLWGNIYNFDSQYLTTVVLNEKIQKKSEKKNSLLDWIYEFTHQNPCIEQG